MAWRKEIVATESSSGTLHTAIDQRPREKYFPGISFFLFATYSDSLRQEVLLICM